MRRALVAGNWKMHGSRAMVRDLAGGLREALVRPSAPEVLVCPPFPYLALAAIELAGSSVGLGAQDLHPAESGAFTGSVSGAMLLDVGCRWVIVGHSERRQLCGEDDALVAAKARAALSAGLTPIVCVGETAAEREAGRTFAVVEAQLEAVLSAAGAAAAERMVLAYEPVWAIGTGLTAAPAQAQEVHERLRSRLQAFDAETAPRVRLLYGGSVKGSNARELAAMPDIDGFLVGGASLRVDEFAAICAAAEGV